MIIVYAGMIIVIDIAPIYAVIRIKDARACTSTEDYWINAPNKIYRFITSLYCSAIIVI